MSNARLQLMWPNKDRKLLTHGADTYEWVDPQDWRATEVRLLEPIQDVGDTSDGNLVIHGDALHALTSLTQLPELRSRYVGKVKLCYIDPPFNTGQAFAHYNDAVEHSVWLTMMRDRLLQIRHLLSTDGSVWVHLDDAEMHRMRSVMDEVFGAENFVGTVVWGKADTSRNDAKQFSVDQDYLLVYSRTHGWRPNRLPRTAAQDAIYTSPDGDPRPWLAKPGHAPGARTHQGMVYAVQSPFTGELLYPPQGSCWRLGEQRMFAALNEWSPYKRVDLDDASVRAGICGVPVDQVATVKAMLLDVDVADARERAAKVQTGVLPEVYFISAGSLLQVKGYKPQGLVPRTLWQWPAVGSNRNSKAESRKLFPELNPFTTPKPERLLQRVLHLATDPGDLILDCFAGSGTTAAVALKMRRRFVTVEVLSSNLDRYVVPRLTKVVNGGDAGGITNAEVKIPVSDLPGDVTIDEIKGAVSTLKALREHGTFGPEVSLEAVNAAEKALAGAARQKTVPNPNGWRGGSGFRVLRVAESMFVADIDGDLYLADWVQDKTLARAVCAQMRYTWDPAGPFAGYKGKSRIAVLDAMATEGAIRLLVAALAPGETVLVVAQAIGDGVEELLRELRKGSKVRKIPTDLARAGVLPSQVITLPGTADGDDT